MALKDGVSLLFQHLFVSVAESMSMYKTCAMLYYYIIFEAEKSSPQQVGQELRSVCKLNLAFSDYAF